MDVEASRPDEPMKVQETIPPNRVLGVFGMSIFTRRHDLEDIFKAYGPVEKVDIIANRQTGRSKGFGFVYFERQEDAEAARSKTNGMTINERQIRVDFSRTEAPHDPTPGFYNGTPITELKRSSDRGGSRGRDGGSRHPARNYDSDRHYAPSRGGDRDRRGSDRDYPRRSTAVAGDFERERGRDRGYDRRSPRGDRSASTRSRSRSPRGDRHAPARSPRGDRYPSARSRSRSPRY